MRNSIPRNERDGSVPEQPCHELGLLDFRSFGFASNATVYWSRILCWQSPLRTPAVSVVFRSKALRSIRSQLTSFCPDAAGNALGDWEEDRAGAETLLRFEPGLDPLDDVRMKDLGILAATFAVAGLDGDGRRVGVEAEGTYFETTNLYCGTSSKRREGASFNCPRSQSGFELISWTQRQMIWRDCLRSGNWTSVTCGSRRENQRSMTLICAFGSCRQRSCRRAPCEPIATHRGSCAFCCSPLH